MKAKITNTGVKIGKSMVTKDGTYVCNDTAVLPVNDVDSVKITCDGIDIKQNEC